MTAAPHPRRYGVGSYTWPWAVASGSLSPLGVVARAESAGLDGVQLCDNLGLSNLVASRSALRRATRDCGIVLELGGRGLAELDSWIDLAAFCDAPVLRLVLDTDDHHPTFDEAVAALRLRVPLLEAQGCTLAVENHDRFPAAILARLVAACDSPAVGVCLDTANSLGAGEGVETVLEHLAAHTVCLHLKDIRVRRVDHLMGFDVRGCEPGTGQIDFDAVCAAAMPRCRSVVLEQWPPEQSVEDTWARAGIEHLRRLRAQERGTGS